jgi:prepilin-type N-terminal cleavage/methylation domain-containing protein
VKSFKGRSRQKGFTLIEMILVIGLMSVATMITFYEKRLDMEQTQARATGVKLYEYNNAVRAWVSQNVGAPNGLKPVGTAWLKSNTCPTPGGSPIAYLPCNFPDMTPASPVRFGQVAVQSDVVTTGAVPNQVTTVTTKTLSGFSVLNGSTTTLRTDLAGLAAVVAAAGGVNSISPMLASTDGSVTSDPALGTITLEASNNGAADAWLRTDGSNTMNSNITYKATNPANLRELTNVSRVQSLTSEILYLGGVGSLAAGQSVVVAANQSVNGVLTVDNLLSNPTGVAVTRGDISALQGRVTASTDVVAGQSLVGSYVKSNPAVNPQMLLSASSFVFTDQSMTTTNPVALAGYADVSQLYILTNSGNKVNLRDMLPNWVHKSSWYAMDGEWIAKPACAPGGVTRVVVVPQSTPTNIYSPPAGYFQSNRGASYAYAIDMGGAWIIRNYPAYNYTANGSALALTYCVY